MTIKLLLQYSYNNLLLEHFMITIKTALAKKTGGDLSATDPGEEFLLKSMTTTTATRSSAKAGDGFLLEQHRSPPPVGDSDKFFSSNSKGSTFGDDAVTDADVAGDRPRRKEGSVPMHDHASSVWATSGDVSLFKQESIMVSKVRELI